jgi:hypothetical protein
MVNLEVLILVAVAEVVVDLTPTPADQVAPVLLS